MQKPIHEPTSDSDAVARRRAEAFKKMESQSASEAALNDPDMMRLWGECASIWDDISQLLWLAFDSLVDLPPGVSRLIFFAPENDTAGR